MLEKLVRLGYATKGAVYGLIGILALETAFGVGGKTTDSSGALLTIASQPFGKFLLIVIAIGLAGYAIWRLIETFIDPENKGTDAKGIGARIGYLSSGIAYSALSIEAASLALRANRSSGNGNSTADWTARVMAQPFGRWLVGLAGAIAIGVGLYLMYKAYKVKFRRKMDLSELSTEQEKLLVQVCRFGVAARGLVFMAIGFFILQAAYQVDPNEVRGLDGVLQAFAAQPFGKVLLAFVALGLVAYAIYLLVQARYLRLKADEVEDDIESKIPFR
ncbi:DUF1206 domain-containing protein [Oscillatoria sp. FACHB-1406]|uniref:DUF1206 domain-containing protein n=1 Tax=Oscillatoria sp. FACHB-1406 TaxID=2692846 RepID=UPI0032209719